MIIMDDDENLLFPLCINDTIVMNLYKFEHII
jgi:hypothetical protein